MSKGPAKQNFEVAQGWCDRRDGCCRLRRHRRVDFDVAVREKGASGVALSLELVSVGRVHCGVVDWRNGSRASADFP
jgi:hypothetical protein